MHGVTLFVTTGGLFGSFCLTYWFTYKLAEKYKWNYISWIVGVIMMIISTGITIGLSFLNQDVMVITSAFFWGFVLGYWGGLIWYKLRYREIKKKGN